MTAQIESVLAHASQPAPQSQATDEGLREEIAVRVSEIVEAWMRTGLTIGMLQMSKSTVEISDAILPVIARIRQEDAARAEARLTRERDYYKELERLQWQARSVAEARAEKAEADIQRKDAALGAGLRSLEGIEDYSLTEETAAFRKLARVPDDLRALPDDLALLWNAMEEAEATFDMRRSDSSDAAEELQALNDAAAAFETAALTWVRARLALSSTRSTLIQGGPSMSVDRSAYEAWQAGRHVTAFDRNPVGTWGDDNAEKYAAPFVQAGWEAWQACAALCAPASQGGTEATPDVTALVEALERIGEATPRSINARSVEDMRTWYKAVAETALSAMPGQSRSEEGRS